MQEKLDSVVRAMNECFVLYRVSFEEIRRLRPWIQDQVNSGPFDHERFLEAFAAKLQDDRGRDFIENDRAPLLQFEIMTGHLTIRLADEEEEPAPIFSFPPQRFAFEIPIGGEMHTLTFDEPHKPYALGLFDDQGIALDARNESAHAEAIFIDRKHKKVRPLV